MFRLAGQSSQSADGELPAAQRMTARCAMRYSKDAASVMTTRIVYCGIFKEFTREAANKLEKSGGGWPFKIVNWTKMQ